MVDSEESQDAATKFIAKAKKAQTWIELVCIVVNVFRSILEQFRSRNTPVTTVLVLMTVIVFIFQSALHLYITGSFPLGIVVILTQPETFTNLTAYLFVNFPWIAWPSRCFYTQE